MEIGLFYKKSVKKVVTLQPFRDFFCILFGGNKKIACHGDSYLASIAPVGGSYLSIGSWPYVQ